MKTMYRVESAISRMALSLTLIGIDNRTEILLEIENSNLFPQRLKVVGSSLPCDLARNAIQVCGGYGFVKEVASTGEQYPLEAIYRDSKVGEIYEGANEIQRMVIARSIFGQDIVG